VPALAVAADDPEVVGDALAGLSEILRSEVLRGLDLRDDVPAGGMVGRKALVEVDGGAGAVLDAAQAPSRSTCHVHGEELVDPPPVLVVEDERPTGGGPARLPAPPQ